MIHLVDIITTDDPQLRDRSLVEACEALSLAELLEQAEQLDQFRRSEGNLYRRVRALFFLEAIYRYQIPTRLVPTASGLIPFDGYQHLLQRRFNEAIDCFLAAQQLSGVNEALASALAGAYHQLGFQTLADQVRRSVRAVRGNQWMFRLGHPADHPLRIRKELLPKEGHDSISPILREVTPVRMDFSHSAWSDIFFLGMDYPEGARVINASVDLAVRGRDAEPRPPIETYLRVIDEPVIRLTSVDLNASTDVTSIANIFDFASDYLGLLKAAVIAAGIVPPGLEGCGKPISDLLDRLMGPGLGLEIVSKINDIPKGSRLAVSTNLLGSLISLMMRATSQISALTGELNENDRRTVAARAILGEWLGGSGGGWQDSGGVWPGIKLIAGAPAEADDPEAGISRGRLMPTHHVLTEAEASAATRQKLQDSLVLVHGGMAQNVGPILEMVTEHYLLRNPGQWVGRQEATAILDQVLGSIRAGNIQQIGELTTRNFEGPLQTIIPWATNRFTDRLIEQCRARYGQQFWGFWMLGGMSGGGMGFLFDPAIKPEAQQWLAETMVQTKRDMQTALPFAMDPVVYDFRINDHGTFADLLEGEHANMPDRYYALKLPELLRRPARDLSSQCRRELERIAVRCKIDANLRTATLLLDSVLPQSNQVAKSSSDSLATQLAAAGFDREQHEQIRTDLRSGRIGLSQNRLSSSMTITDVEPQHIVELRGAIDSDYVQVGQQAIRDGRVAVVTLAAGVGSRWTQGAGVCKALHPFHKFAGRHRSFIEVHLAKNRFTTEQYGGVIPHVITTSYLTEFSIRQAMEKTHQFGFQGPVYVSSGRSVGLRMVPMVRDLQFLWEETAQQILDSQQQKVRDSGRSALMQWARACGEGSDYTDNMPSQCMHPVGHWYEIPNMLRNGLLHQLLTEQASLKYLMLHNVDTLGASVDPGMLGAYLTTGSMLGFEVIGRRLEDRGGGLALVDGRPRLIEGLAMPSESLEFALTFYNANTTWIDIDKLLDLMSLTRADLADPAIVDQAVRKLAKRLPTYITLKDVKKRWGHAQEDVFPVAQFERLWGDMTSLPDVSCSYLATTIQRGQQLKAQAQLDPWLRDGSAAYIDSICSWTKD